MRRRPTPRSAPATALTLILFATLPAPARAADPLLLDRPDLHAHFWVSYGLSLTLTEILEGPEPSWGPAWGTGWAVLAATGIVGLLGLTKELVDPKFSGEDLAADALGLGLNAGLQFLIEF